jgi:hypothetical protein
MKCVTKAKRRATLSLCGLGWLDETEIETIKDVKPVAGPDAMGTGNARRRNVVDTAVVGDGYTGAGQMPESEREPASAPAPAETGPLDISAIQVLEQQARAAAEQGSEALSQFWKGLKTQQQQNVVAGLRSELVALRDAADEKLRQGVDPLTGEVLAEKE